MDPKKQKRLGAAPIASFEKSLEDATSANTGVVMPISLGAVAATLTQSSMYQQRASNINAKHDINSNSNNGEHKMDAKITNSSVAIETTAQTKQKETRDANWLEEVPVAVSKQFSDGKRAPTLKAAANDANNQQLYKGFSTLATPQTPRIELSRASSSSTKEEDSRESSPENVFEQVGTGTLQETIVLGFREEGALELRSSTEELYFMDAAQKKEEQTKLEQQQQQQQQAKRSSPHIFKYEDHQIYLQQHQRKDSASSEVAALLCISGRTSRISSVGSQGSAVSRLSAVSGVSRSPSPHRMLLETSFCGPKPVENVVDSRMPSSVEPHTVELLEKMLLRRKQDPTQAVLAEGIKIQGSPKKQTTNSLSNGDTKAIKIPEQKNRISAAKSATIGAQRTSTKSPGQMVVGKTPSGTEYIRINLKPDHMYADKGIAPNERVVEAPNTLTPVYATSQKKPGTLSLGRNMLNENLLTPTASPKATRHVASSAKEQISRSPSPAAQSVSRKSSFSSLFRFGGGGKDSPDSPRERSRSRSKSKDRTATQSQNVTPSKQKSVLAIFKPSGKRGSNTGIEVKTSSKSSSPIDGMEPHLRSKSQTPVPGSASTSRPGSRLRYYDEPVEGVIHIPLHTPTEERETRKLLQGIQKLIEEPVKPIPAPITASQLAAAAAALKPVGARKNSGNGNAAKSVISTRVTQNEKTKCLENIDAIQTLSQDEDSKLPNWSLEVQRHSSQDSQETLVSESSYSNAIRLGLKTAKHLPDVKEQDVMQENGINAEAEALIHRLPSLDSNTSVCETKIIETVATVNTTCAELPSAQNIKDESVSAKEKRRLLFATRLGSGSQEQVFSTQFSISKTESLSSQLSERGQDTIIESPESEGLQRQATVIRRSEEETESFAQTRITTKFIGTAGGTIKRQGSTDMRTLRQRSFSTSEDERCTTVTKTTTTAVVLRRKESSDEPHRKSRSTSEEDGTDTANQRHSRYLENFDVRKKYHENVLPRKPKRQATADTISSKDIDPFSVQTCTKYERKPTIPQPPPPTTVPTPSPPVSNVNSTVGSRTPTPTKTTAVMRSQSQSPVERSKHTPSKPPRNITPTRRSQVNTPTSPSPVPSHTPPSHGKRYESPLTDRQSKAVSTDEPIESSESERDSTGVTALEHKRRHTHSHVAPIEDNESTGLVSQESFDDELPYIPTTLPEERSQGVCLIPMKERANMELKTCPVERPRSTTPLNPSHLEEFGCMPTPQESPHEIYGSIPVRGEKLRISLPRKDPAKEKVQSVRSPRRSSNASGKSWFEFAGEGLRATTTANLERKDSNKQLLDNDKDKKPSSAPAVSKTALVAQKAVTSGKSTQRKLSGHWIDFENIPEKRKPPKRITALPKDSTATSGKLPQNKQLQTQPDLTNATSHADAKLHYNYVKPEDCQCECHELGRGPEHSSNAEICLEGATEKVANVDLLHQVEDMLPLLDTEGHEGIERSHLSDSSREFSYYTDDECDIPERRRKSTRRTHSTTNSEFPRRDYAHSPRNRKFPDNRH